MNFAAAARPQLPRKFLIFSFVALSGCSSAPTARSAAEYSAKLTPPAEYPGPPHHAKKPQIASFISKGDAWYQSPAGQRVCDNILGWQNPNGGWFKNYDATKPRPAVLPDDPRSGPIGDDDSVWHQVSTFDNDATYSEMCILAHAYRLSPKDAYKNAFERGLQYMFVSQYPNGGWPQRFPLQNNYGRTITFNDDAMTHCMMVMKSIIDQDPDYTFVSEPDRQQAQTAFDKGLDCIQKCQIRVNGKLTAWCQQHDEVTFAPAGGRTFELPGIAGNESVKIVELLMSIQHPNARVREAIESAYAWFEASKITGKRWKMVTGSQYPMGRDRVLIDDPDAPPLWARYYDIQIDQPFFTSRDGIPKGSVTEISPERRNGYGWYGTWGERLEKKYPAWKLKMESEATSRPSISVVR